MSFSFDVPGIAQPSKDIPISVYENNQPWDLPAYQKAIVIIDNAVIKLIPHITENSLVIKLDSSEQVKSADFLNQIIYSHSEILKNFDAIIVIGGGIILNFGTALAAHICKLKSLKFNLILVPTNVLAMADVAYGSLGKLNETPTHSAVRITYDPDQIILDTRFLRNLSPEQKKQGIAECLKHALLQDSGVNPNSPSFLDCLHLLKSENPNVSQLFSCILLTIKAKADIITAMHHGHPTAEYLLTYGHVDSDPREKASHFTLSHGDSVLLSLIAELTLIGQKDLANAVRAVLPFTSLTKVADKINFDRQTMLEVYRRSAKPRFCAGDDNYFVIELPKIGAYAEIRQKLIEIKMKKFHFDDLFAVINDILSELIQLKHTKSSSQFFNEKKEHSDYISSHSSAIKSKL